MPLSVWSPRPNAPMQETLSPTVSIYGLPVLEIAPVTLSDKQIKTVLSVDALFYVSQYAVNSLFAQIPAETVTDKIHLAIGEKTAASLSAAGIHPTLTAKPPFNSEALLADIALQSLSFDTLALVSGQDGRRLFADRLEQQNKKVVRIISYQRNKCHISSQNVIEFLDVHAINAVMLTSCAVVDAIAGLLPDEMASEVWQFPAFALSRRIASYAEHAGFTQVIAADSANRTALYAKMLAWQNKQ